MLGDGTGNAGVDAVVLEGVFYSGGSDWTSGEW